ncbi:MAG: peptide deformylase [Candidatus Berkiella sp.]
MAILTVKRYPHPALRKIAAPTTDFGPALKEAAASMLETLYKVQGWGLSANQVGLDERLFVLDMALENVEPLCMVNPVIIEKANPVLSDEDCLSFPGVHVTQERARDITVQYQDLDGNQQTSKFEGLLACGIQHEIDLLNGVLIIDSLSKLKRDRLLKQYKKVLTSGHVHGPQCNHGHHHDHTHEHVHGPDCDHEHHEHVHGEHCQHEHEHEHS